LTLIKASPLPMSIVSEIGVLSPKSVDPHRGVARSLIEIIPSVRTMEQERQTSGLRPASPLDAHVTNAPIFRFAVAVFDSWDAAQMAIRDVSNGFSHPQNISCLGLRRVLEQRADARLNSDSQQLRGLSFPDNTESISCTAGPVADRLSERARLGARTLQAALGHWLIARHAAQLAEAIQDRKIIVWVQLFNDDDERRAYRSLLARSSHSVGVHDLVGN